MKLREVLGARPLARIADLIKQGLASQQTDGTNVVSVEPRRAEGANIELDKIMAISPQLEHLLAGMTRDRLPQIVEDLVRNEEVIPEADDAGDDRQSVV